MLDASLCLIAQEPADLPRQTFDLRFRYTDTPVVIRNATLASTAAQAFRARTTLAALAEEFGSATVTLSSANAFSYGRKRQTVNEYLAALPSAAEAWAHAAEADDDQAAADTFYWFGEHGGELKPLLSRYPLPRYVWPAVAPTSMPSLTSLFGLAAAAQPPAVATDDDPPREPALSFGVAPDRSGVPFHVRAPSVLVPAAGVARRR